MKHIENHTSDTRSDRKSSYIKLNQEKQTNKMTKKQIQEVIVDMLKQLIKPVQ